HELQAVGTRQTHVDESEIEVLLIECGFRVLGARQVIDREARLGEAAAQRIRDESVVFDYEYAHRVSPGQRRRLSIASFARSENAVPEFPRRAALIRACRTR